MANILEPKRAHPTGEAEAKADGVVPSGGLDTFGGTVHVRWDPEAVVTPNGQMAFFVEFLKTGGLWDPWVQECPLKYTSPNAPGKVDVLGTMLLGILSGYSRYAHVTAIRSDGVTPHLLGMNRVVSEDSMRRAFEHTDAEECAQWMRKHLRICYEPLLGEPWVLDIDTTVKPLYGHQEMAVKGYNPTKPGRPSHTYHTYFIGALRMVLVSKMLSTSCLVQ